MQNNLRDQFLIDPSITFLNFGSFGACPIPIFAEYQQWQLELEREPIQFITVNGPKYLQQSRSALGEFLNCDADDLVFVTNPSYAVNIIAKSLDLQPGDEVLSSNIEYGACDMTWNHYCEKKGAKYVRQPIELPLTTKEKFVEDLFKGYSERTKLIFISHITSSTALKFPVEEICAMARKKGVMVFIDGAHAPAHTELDLKKLGVDIYTGACHKWMMTPKGCSFLYVKKDKQDLFDPLIISWGFKALFPSGSKFQDYHQMQGTRDFSAFLTVPSAIRFMKENDWKSISAQCRKMVRENALRFTDLIGSKPLCSVTEEFLGQMFSIPVKNKEPEKFQRKLFEKYRIEIPVMRQGESVFIRYSINAFNTQSDLDKLYDTLRELRTELV